MQPDWLLVCSRLWIAFRPLSDNILYQDFAYEKQSVNKWMQFLHSNCQDFGKVYLHAYKISLKCANRRKVEPRGCDGKLENWFVCLLALSLLRELIQAFESSGCQRRGFKKKTWKQWKMSAINIIMIDHHQLDNYKGWRRLLETRNLK